MAARPIVVFMFLSVRVQPKGDIRERKKKKYGEKRERKSDERTDRTDNGGTEFRGEQKA